MSTQAPAPGFAPDPTIDPVGSPNLIGPKLPIPHLGIAFDKPRPWWFVLGIMLGQLGIFIALIGPATVSIQIKASQLASSPAEAASITAFAVAPGALAAVIFNALGGRISDRSTSRFGRRRPWLIIGALGMLVGLALIALAPGAALMAVGWFLAQAAGNLALAAYVASIADQLSPAQYGRASGLVGIAGNLAVMIATWLASAFAGNMLALFLVPGLIGMVLVLVFAFMLPEPVLRENRLPFNLRELVLTFWRNPVKFPDFGLAWGGRFTIILASFMFTTFRVLYMENHLGLEPGDAVRAVATGVTIYTVTSMVASLLAGWLSDVLGRRKILVAASILIFGLATYLLLHADTVTAFYVVEAIMGLAYGTYIAVDLALVLEVLPDREQAGKDMGVFNIANALPQSLAPAFGGFLLANLGGGTDFTALLVAALVAAVIGAVLTMFIRGVK
ncbi:Na+/melibiose symporter-like transporter [Brachybacterium sp. AG952]|uniref:MFS transporter n=1 Tax=Brachybacterium sp. AG952 TaxID=2183989 RepID=UPI00105CA78D|nr:MFS transporter [Brachybacterium sp. AG952]TDP79243.1 Na+/melibiose symporter-like transporter [Brachybacterium sp. AG952]